MHELQITHIYACPTNHKFQSNKNMCTWTSRDLHKNVHTGVIHDDPKTEKQTNKIVVYLFNGILSHSAYKTWMKLRNMIFSKKKSKSIKYIPHNSICGLLNRKTKPNHSVRTQNGGRDGGHSGWQGVCRRASRVLARSVCRTSCLVKTYGAVCYALCPSTYRSSIQIK